jgi:hypothetical protein
MSAKLEDNTGELQELRLGYQRLQEASRKILSKVDPNLNDDLLLRREKDPYIEPMYRIEVLTRDRIDTEATRWHILGKTGMMPAIYDHGTHFVTDQKLSLETLKEISDSDDVIEVTEEYSDSFASNGPMHECHVCLNKVHYPANPFDGYYASVFINHPNCL